VLVLGDSVLDAALGACRNTVQKFGQIESIAIAEAMDAAHLKRFTLQTQFVYHSVRNVKLTISLLQAFPAELQSTSEGAILLCNSIIVSSQSEVLVLGINILLEL
jgi:hypothetical protein